jgi:hypothetical protein
MSVKVYDPDQISVIFAGVPAEGFADGEMVTIEHTTPRFSSVVGTTGEVVRSKSKDKRATITVKLMQTSNTNDLYSAIAVADDKAPNGAGIAPVMVRDRQGRALYAGKDAWIVGQPDASYDRTAKSREWKIEVEALDDFTGGA